MKKFIVLLTMLSGVAMAQPKLNIPITGLSVSTTFITPTTTVVSANMYVQNLDSVYDFSDSLYIKVGVKDTLDQVFEMSSVNVGNQNILKNDSIYLTSVSIEVNTSLFMDGNNTVVIWPAAPNSSTFDSTEVIFFYTSINELLSSDLPIKLGPNPTQDRVFLGDPENLVKQVRIRDLNGKLLGTYASDKMISVTHLPAGLYTMELQMEQAVLVRKLLIER